MLISDSIRSSAEILIANILFFRKRKNVAAAAETMIQQVVLMQIVSEMTLAAMVLLRIIPQEMAEKTSHPRIS